MRVSPGAWLGDKHLVGFHFHQRKSTSWKRAKWKVTEESFQETKLVRMHKDWCLAQAMNLCSEFSTCVLNDSEGLINQ